MVVTKYEEVEGANMSGYNREKEIREFRDSKVSVKEIAESGLEKIPRIFAHNFNKPEDKPGNTGKSQLQIPVIDIAGVNQDNAASRADIISKIQDPCEQWGFFQVINHGIPGNVLDEMIHAVRTFHEQDEDKKRLYISHDPSAIFTYNSHYVDRSQLKAPAWSDRISSSMDPPPPNFETLPVEFRNPILEYSSHVKNLAVTIFGLLSEALGLSTSYLRDIGCTDGPFFIGHYYPPCPEPELTIGNLGHTYIVFMNVLLQDQVGGLQVLHQDEWVDVNPLRGALVINLGDMMQLITNGRFKSSFHRAVSKKVGPRISVASCFGPLSNERFTSQLYRPIQELLSEKKPPVYKSTTIRDYMVHFFSNLVNENGLSPLQHFKV